MTERLWSQERRHGELYAAEYAKQVERIARIRSNVSAGLPVVAPPPPQSPPPRREPSPSWDAAPADLQPLLRSLPAPSRTRAGGARPVRVDVPLPAAPPRRPPTLAAASSRRRARLAAARPTLAAARPRLAAAPPRRRARLAAAVVVLAVAATATVLTRGGSEAPTTFRVPGQPTGIVASDGRVWVAGPSAGAVWILDGASGRPAAPAVRTGGTPARLALDERWAWIADTERGAVVRAARTGESALRPFPSGPDVTDVAVAAGTVWTASSADGTLRMIGAGGRRRVLHIGARLLALAADGRRVVAADAGTGVLLRLWAGTGRAAGPPVPLGGTPVDVALAGDRAWVADAGAGTVRRVDLRTGRVGPPVAVGPATVAVAADRHGVYAVSRGDRTLVEIDATTGDVRSRLRLAHAPTALALDPRHVWIAAGDREVIRVDR